MRQVEVLSNGILAGFLTEVNRKLFIFRYEEKYFVDANQPAVSLTLPKTKQEYQSEYLFPAFANMLSEGANREVQSRLLHIDEEDDFGILMATAQYDTIGAITFKPIMNKTLNE